MTKQEDWQAAVATTVDEFGKLDVLVVRTGFRTSPDASADLAAAPAPVSGTTLLELGCGLA